MTRWLVLVNPHAGRGPSAAPRVRRALTKHGIEADIVETGDIESLEHALDRAVLEGRYRFVAVGGDGTVNAVANAILTRQFPQMPVLGVLPGGTGCDLLRTFAISQKMEEAAAHLATDTVYPIDVGVVEGEWGSRYFVNVGDVGIIAGAARRAQRMSPWWGKARYLIAFLAALPSFRVNEITVTAGGRTFTGEGVAAVFANAQYFGGGFNIAPKAAMMDGDLDVQVFAVRKRAAARLVPKVMRGLHLTDRGVRRFVAPSAHIETRDPWPVEVDGEYLGNTPVTVRVARGLIALKI
jgi:YegS/Rv2252/BmrU family lipid kinase